MRFTCPSAFLDNTPPSATTYPIPAILPFNYKTWRTGTCITACTAAYCRAASPYLLPCQPSSLPTQLSSTFISPTPTSTYYLHARACTLCATHLYLPLTPVRFDLLKTTPTWRTLLTFAGQMDGWRELPTPPHPSPHCREKRGTRWRAAYSSRTHATQFFTPPPPHTCLLWFCLHVPGSLMD